MTKEEMAIKALENMKIGNGCGYTDATEIFDAAIKALKQESILDKYKAESETETWHGMNGITITAPKGTFDRIFNEADEEEDDV